MNKSNAISQIRNSAHKFVVEWNERKTDWNKCKWTYNFVLNSIFYILFSILCYISICYPSLSLSLQLNAHFSQFPANFLLVKRSSLLYFAFLLFGILLRPNCSYKAKLNMHFNLMPIKRNRANQQFKLHELISTCSIRLLLLSI